MAVRKLEIEAALRIITTTEESVLPVSKKGRTGFEGAIYQTMRPIAMIHEWLTNIKKDPDKEIALASLIGIAITTVTNCGIPDHDSAIYAKHLMDASARKIHKQKST